jgi:hypothetical protein
MFQRGYHRKKIVDIGANIHIKYEGGAFAMQITLSKRRMG